MDRLTALRAFVLVAETGSFSEAARRLPLSKSMVSRLVASLESELGVRLLQRTTRSVTPTEAGRAYVERCQRILADLEEADQLVSQLQAVPKGILRISAPMSFGIRHLAPALPPFFHRFPEVRLDLSLSDRFVDLVEEGFDVALRIGRLADSSLVARRLCPVRMCVCASPAYLESHGTPQTPEDLPGHECLMSAALVATGWRLLGPDGKVMQVPVGGRFHVNNGDAPRVMALAGCGIAYLPTFFVGDDLRSGALVPLLQAFMPQDSAMHAVYPHGRHLSPKVRAFVDYLAETFTPSPYWDHPIKVG